MKLPNCWNEKTAHCHDDWMDCLDPDCPDHRWNRALSKARKEHAMSIKQIKPFKKFNTHPPGVKKSFGIVKSPKPSTMMPTGKTKTSKLVGQTKGKKK